MMFINNSKKLMKDEKDKKAKENPMAWILQNLELLHTR
jgi:hypothetical protein